ncbi:MAG: glycoside-pentoside-hexuronide (GPH):cation symporter [Caldilineaceae bacterium]|nr:glycoside-pentoside-hexuronide (GPH):cation symporter [Caldilineaceae bacterium]
MSTLQPARKLSTWTKAIYGLGDWGASSATTARSLFWLFFIVSVVGVDVGLAGIAFIIGRIWDGINDPLVGTLSDRFRSRWGRRRPFMLLGAVPFGVGFFLMFNRPPFESDWAIALYYGVVFIFYDTAYTIVNAPYAALTAELTEDYDERSSLAGWRMANSIFAALLTAGLFKLLAENVFAGWFSGADAIRDGYAVAGALWGLVITVTPMLVVAFVREPKRILAAETERINFVQITRDVFANRPFRIGAIIYLLAFTAVDIITAVFVWFLVYYMQLHPPLDSLVLAIVLGVAFLSMPLTVWLMKLYGKGRAYVGMMLFWSAVMIGISLLPPGNVPLVMAAAALAGLGYGAASAVPWAIVSDVIEDDEWRTGKRREGVYAGYLMALRKLATAFAVGIVVPQVLAAASFQAGAAITQPESAILALRVFMGIVPTFLLLLSMVAAMRYPITRESHTVLRQKLEDRRLRMAEAGK